MGGCLSRSKQVDTRGGSFAHQLFEADGNVSSYSIELPPSNQKPPGKDHESLYKDILGPDNDLNLPIAYHRLLI